MKRNRIWPYLGIGAITALILALVLVALPAGAATSGNVQGVQGDLSILDKPDSDKDSEAIAWVSPSGMDSFYIHLEDSDLDVASSHTQTVSDPRPCPSPGSHVVIARSGDSNSDPRTPILDTNEDGRVDFNDVTVNESNITVISVDGSRSTINVQCAAIVTSANFTYATSAVDTTFTGSETTVDGMDTEDMADDVTHTTGGADRVTVTSGADRTGITARLVETRRGSGEFELMVKVCDDPECSQTGRMLGDPESEDKGELHDADPDDDDTVNQADNGRHYYVPSGTARGSMVYAVYDDPETTGTGDDETERYVLQKKPATTSTDPSDIKAQIQVFVLDEDSTADPKPLMLTTEKYLSVDKVDAGSGELTIITAKAIPIAATSARATESSGSTGTPIVTTITTTDGAFAGFNRGDLIEIKLGTAGNEQGGDEYIVADRPTENTIKIEGRLDNPIGPAGGDGALIVDLGIAFTVSYRTPTGTDGEAMIRVNPAGDTVTIVYNDPDDSRERATIKVETTAPAIDELSDSSNGAGGDATPTFFAEVTDQGSGITTNTKDKDSIEFVFMLMNPNGPELDGPHSVKRDFLRDEDDITGGFSVEAEFDSRDLSTNAKEYEIHWWVRAMDMAGNPGVSDNPAVKDNNKATVCVPGDFIVNDNSVTPGLCDPFTVRVDTLDPKVERAITGNWWDPSKDSGEELQKGGAAKSDMVMVLFTEPMDGSSFEAADFRVDGSRPADVDWYNAEPQEGASDQGELCIRCAAFLTLSSPLDPNDTPRVQVTGEVSDSAGNILDEANIAAADDGISAKLTVTVTGTHMAEDGRPVTNKTVTVTVTSDETLTSRPKLDIRKVVRKDRSADFETSSSAAVTDLGIAPASGTRTWTAEVDVLSKGLYNVYVIGIGQGDGVMAAAGVAPGDFDEDSLDHASVMLIEVDTGIEQPGFIPAKMSEDPDVLLRIDFASEANEYGLMEEKAKAARIAGAGDIVTANPDADPPVAGIKQGDTLEAAVGAIDAVDFDTYGAVSLVSVMLDGPGYDEQDVTDMFFTRNDVLFSWRPGDLALGEYTISVTAMDEAGNEVDLTPATFEIVAPTPYSLAIDPGLNLISLPGDPVDMDINSVIPTDGTIDLVTTYDPGDPLGPWLVATWNADTGNFEGTLTTIDAMHGYWVRAASPIDLGVPLQRQTQAGSPPPTIAVSAGWNLVPVVDLGRSAEGTTISAAAYFAGVQWSLAYTYDATEAAWVRIPNIPPADTSKGEEDPDDLVRNVEVGKGYWIWATEAGTIVP